MNKKLIHIKGMHCDSCELLIEDELNTIPSVSSSKVSHKKGVAEIYYQGELKDEDVDKAVEEAGYTVGYEHKPWFTKDSNKYKDLLISAGILFTLFLFAKTFGIFELANTSGGSYSSLPVVFIIGITAGLSTCMALVGGLVLGASARFAEIHPNATTLQKFKPHLFFNLGRIISFFVLGGVIGFAGSIFQLSLSSLGYMTILVGGVMLVLGIKLMEISPKISKFNLVLPKQLTRFLGIKKSADKEYSHKNSVIMGAMTFFLPCGFTQAMQLYAISTGSVTAGALTMGVFAIGTAPGLLGIGGLTSLIKGTYSKLFFKTVGLAVALLAFYNISNGYNLTGLQLSDYNPIVINLGGSEAVAGTNTEEESAPIAAGVQIIKATYTASNDMSPRSFSVKAGQPVRLEVLAKDDGVGCMGSVAVPKLSKQVEVFKKGETNIFEFTPKSKGAFQITCAMGIPHGTINVI